MTLRWRQLITNTGSRPDRYAQALAAGVDPIEGRDANWECRHGRLPGDGTRVCGCWEEEQR